MYIREHAYILQTKELELAGMSRVRLMMNWCIGSRDWPNGTVGMDLPYLPSSFESIQVRASVTGSLEGEREETRNSERISLLPTTHFDNQYYYTRTLIHGMSIKKSTHVQDEPIKDKSRSARLLPVFLLVVALVSYTVQTELASYVQHTLDYKKPYFLFFCTHSSVLAHFSLSVIQRSNPSKLNSLLFS